MTEEEAGRFWNSIQKFHERASLEIPGAEKGLEAVIKIRRVLEPYWRTESNTQHPLVNRLRVASEVHYKWLVYFARKLAQVERIPGYRAVVPRLGLAGEFPGAWAELDFALKFSLSGCPCEFVQPGNEPSPDLQAAIAGRSVEVEVTSMNLPDEDSRGLDAISTIMGVTFQEQVAAGGIVGRPPNPTERKQMISLVRAKANESKTAGRLVIANIPGLLNCYLAPWDKDMLIPSYWRGHFEIRDPTPLPQKDKLSRAIEGKVKRHFTGKAPAILVVYDRFSSDVEIQQLLDGRDVELVAGTFPYLVAVILVHPFVSYEPIAPKVADNGRKKFLEYSLPDTEAERCIVWENPMANNAIIHDELIRCLCGFSSKLLDLT